MPSKSGKQHRFMAAVAHNPDFARRAGVPASVGKEFVKADKGRRFKRDDGTQPEKQDVNKPEARHGKQAFFQRGGEVKESKAMEKKELAFMKRKGAPKSMVKHEKAEMKGYAKGGFVSAADGVAKRGKTKARRPSMAGGGSC
jgi:hypothetical protein